MPFQLTWLCLFTLTASSLAVIFMPGLVLRAQVHPAGKVLRVLLLLLLSAAAGLPFARLDADTLHVAVLVDASASVESPAEMVALDSLAMDSLARAGVRSKVRHYRFASNPAVLAEGLPHISEQDVTSMSGRGQTDIGALLVAISKKPC